MTNDKDTETQRFFPAFFFRLAEPLRTEYQILVLCAAVFLWLIVPLMAACGVPNLEAAQCVEARESVRKFYSFHFGGDMKPSPENLKLREPFLSKALAARLASANLSDNDPFTYTIDFPKTFRVGKCEAVSSEKTRFEILLFWKDDATSRQQTIAVETIKEDGDWKINEINGPTSG